MKIERRKLFSSTTTQRRKLFSSVNDGGVSVSELKTVICRDCGYSMETLAATTNIICPKCGGNRFNIVGVAPVSSEQVPEPVKEEEEVKTFSRRSLFGDFEQKEFSQATNEFEEKLKTYSGKTLSEDEVEKIFSEHGYTCQDLIDKGFANVTDDNNIKLFDTAFLQSKLFSKLIVTVTKELDLDSLDKPKEEIIDMLAENDAFSPKSIMLIKKAHSLPIVKESEFSDTETEEWMKDSGIANDLRLEFGGRNMDIKEFTKVLEERYDDAPDNIIDVLSSKGVIVIQGSQVDILK